MKHLPALFLGVVIFCLSVFSAGAQTITYLDSNYKAATATDYTFKRVIKYKEPIINPNIGTGYYGTLTSNPQPTGLHVCTLIDYYNPGEPALVVKVVTLSTNCTEWAFDGLAVYYYKNGEIKRKEPYNAGRLHGTVIYYNEDGSEAKKEEYEKGKLIEAGRFAAAANSPLIGVWRYEERTAPLSMPSIGFKSEGTLTKLLTANFSANGILEIKVQNGFINGQSFFNGSEKTNWRYISKTDSTGVLEQYQGDDLLYRGNVVWSGKDQFEYINTFHQNPESVGQRLLYKRQY